MQKKIRILHLEDKRSDADIVKRELTKSDIDFELLWVTNKKDFKNALKEFSADIILSDHSLPSFGSLQALKILKETGMEIPFILVTATMSDEFAVDLMKEGIADYILKDRLQRLPKAIVSILEKYNSEKEKEKYLEDVIRNEKLFRALIEKNADMMTMSLPEGNLLYASPSLTAILGFSTEEFYSRPAFEFIHPDDFREVKGLLDSPGQSFFVQQRMLHKNGSYIWCEGTITNMLHDPNINALVSNFRDITERKKAEQKILKANRLYAFLSAINKSILHIKEEIELLNEVCNIAIKVGQFKMAWIGLLNETGKLNIISTGNDKTVTKKMEKHTGIDFNRPELRSTPTGIALATGKYAVINDVQKDVALEVWKKEYLQNGIRANISLPIRKFGKVTGVISLNSTLEYFFDKEETTLLEEAADNISFALDVFEKEKQRLKSLADLESSEARLKEAQKLAHISNWEIDLVSNVNSWSDEFYNIFRIKKGDIQPSPEAFLSFIHPEDLHDVKESIEKAFGAFEGSSFQSRINTKDGSKRYIYSEWKFAFDKKKKPVRLYGILQDITEKKVAQETIVKSEIQIRNFAKHLNKVQEEERAHIARELHDELGQQLAGIKMGLSLITMLEDKGKMIEQAGHTSNDVDEVIQSMRKIATELRPGILDSLGLIPSLEWLAEEFERKKQVKCVVELNVKELRFEKNISTCFFRVCQESLTNIFKHAQASKVTIKIDQNEHDLILQITDNGKGISKGKLLNPFSMGLLGMHERASAIGGDLIVRKGANSGTVIQLKVRIAAMA